MSGGTNPHDIIDQWDMAVVPPNGIFQLADD
jgi:hypothetical protein